MALTPSQRRALQLRHLAAIARAEAELRAAVLATLVTLAAAMERAETPAEQQAAVTAADEDVNESWLLLLLLLFRKRYDDAGGDPARRAAAELEYTESVRPNLQGVLGELIEGQDPEMLATRVARTQVISGYNGGAFKGVVLSPNGGTLMKTWLSLRDLRVRPTHHEADGQTVPFNQKFYVGGFSGDYPGDPSLPPSETVNCRCVLVVDSDLSPVVAAVDGELPNGWRGRIAGLDIPTGDGRMLMTPPGGLRTRQYPMALTRKHVGMDDIWIGTVDYAWTEEDGLYGEGSFDLGGDDGREAARQLVAGLETVSIDPDEVTWTQMFLNSEGKVVPFEEAVDEEAMALREGYSVLDAMSDWRLAGLAVVSIPAYDEARIEPVYDYVPRAEMDAEEDAVFEEMLAKRKKKGKRWPSYEEFAAEPVVAAVTGSTTLPIAETSRSWDGGGAAGRVFAWASDDEGNLNVSKASRAFLWRDGDGTKRGDYKFGFADVIDGELTIIPRGVSAAAARLNQAKGVDQGAVGKKICTLYRRIQKADKSWPDCPIGNSQASIVAAVGGQTFKSEFFADPQFDGPTPLTVTPEGRVYGHVALFDSCYMAPGGRQGCLKPPRGADFSRFEVHGAKMDDGSIKRVGVITFGEGHSTAGSLKASQRQYADLSTVAAKVVTGEDEFGVWVSGEVVDAFRDRAYDLLLSPLSGHWEPDLDNRGKLTMIAAHVVVVPGYAVPRVAAAYDTEGAVEAVMFAAPAARLDAEVEVPVPSAALKLAQLRMRDRLKTL